MNNFSYYHGSDAEQFNFFRLPKKLIQDPQFSSLSGEAKILYGVLLDRMTLSLKNGWVDAENRIYIIYTVKEVQEEFNCCKRTAISLMAELDNKHGIGLIEKKRQGLGKPNLIFVKNFNSKVVGESVGFQEVQDCASLEVQDCAPLEVQDCAPLEVQDCASLEVQDCAPLEVQDCAPLNSKTYNNKTDNSYINLSIHQSADVIGSRDDGLMDRQTILRMFEEKLEYHALILDTPCKKAEIDEIFKLLADTYCGHRPQSVGGCLLSSRDIRERFNELTLEHIRYVLQTLQNNTTEIKNIRAYLLTCLYNAPATMRNFYQAEVNHAWGT